MKCGLRFKDMHDGMSMTLMFTTRYADCGGQATTYSASPAGTSLVDGVPATGGPPASGVASAAGKGGFFGAGSHDQKADRTSNRATFQIAPTRDTCIADDSFFGHSFTSSGISVAFCDGTTRTIHPNVSPTMFCRALCPSDGFPLENNWAD
jgi:hypothetical protein